jgi:hypothetical protein
MNEWMNEEGIYHFRSQDKEEFLIDCK